MKVAVALGSGGARGYAHIGAIRELRARGHDIVFLSGSSIGAVVGGVTAAGKLDEFEQWVRGLSQRDVLRLLDVSFTGGGAIRGDKVMGAIGELLDNARIEELAIPFTAVATDVRARREVWFTRGPVDVALRASFAIPSVISPAVVAGRLLVDGGVTNPVPLEPLALVDADLVMAVSLTGRRVGSRESTVVESSDPVDTHSPTVGNARVAPDDGDDSGTGADRLQDGKGVAGESSRARTAIGDRLRSAAGDVRDKELLRAITTRLGLFSDEDVHDDVFSEDTRRSSDNVDRAVRDGERHELGALPPSLGMFEVVAQSIDAMESLLTAYRMAGSHPDVLVDIPADTCSTFDFHRAEEIIEVGRTLTAQALDRAGC